MKKEKRYFSYKNWYLNVWDWHELYYELYGNPKWIPVLFLHGWPGGWFRESEKDFFDEDKYNVLFYDQRWASKSRPFWSIKNNTTWDLVSDINKLLDYLGFKNVYVFWWSWWSTLALVYAINNSNRVLGMVIRGIFLSNKYSIDHYLKWWVKEFYPEVWQRFISLVPAWEDPLEYYLENMNSEDKEIKSKFLYEWSRYEMSIFSINKIDNVDDILDTFSYESMSILEAYYLKNNCFLEEDYILNNTNKIKDKKISIVHWRFDFICPPLQAFILHSKLGNSKLNITNAGHSSLDEENKKMLISELNRITK